MAKKQTGGTPATVALTRAGVAFTLRPYKHRAEVTAYGEEAVEALGSDPRRVFKTLVTEVVSGSAGPELVVAVVPVAQHVDLKALAAAVGAKRAALAEAAVAERSTGYVLGGISPLGQRARLRTVLDSSALAFPTVLVSAGKRGLQVELAPADLVRATAALVAPVAG
jgi:Cys-tRNA(Pro)/Cys-tRNA(Cys) deacylase